MPKRVVVPSVGQTGQLDVGKKRGFLSSPMSAICIDSKSPESKLQEDVSTFNDPDDEFGGKEARKALERKLLWKLDLRMSILVVIYILNYVNSNIDFSI